MRTTHAPHSTARAGMRTAAWFAASLWVAGSAIAQIPDQFQNLKVLPQDIEKRELVEVMKSFCSALDVRCTHCHVGEEGAPLSEVDFVSDDNKHKQVARVMMQMVDAINKTHLPKTGHDTSELLQVQCVTCHRGQAKPRALEEVLTVAVTNKGIDAALGKYRELRERYYGSATFDFSSSTLIRLAQQLAGADQTPAAIAFLELNAEHYPDEKMSFFFLGELHAKAGDKAKAIESFESALERDPKNPFILRKLEQLRD